LRLAWATKSALLVVVALLGLSVSPVIAQTPGPQVTPEQVKAKFHNMSFGVARSLGYTLTSDCVVNPANGSVMGYHAYKPGSLDGHLDPFNPEILLLLPDGNNLRVVGVEWEAVGQGPFSLFGQPFQSTPGHPGMWFPHHALHLYFEPQLQFLDFSPHLAGRCTPLPIVDTAFAVLHDAHGTSLGTVRLDETVAGVVEISLEARGLPAGISAVHVHAVGRCDAPDFLSAGGHFNPFGKTHGVYFNPNGPHAGDIFGTGIMVAPDGSARARDASDRFSLAHGPARLFDEDGASIVIHVGSDDHHTDPTGNAGGRIACGVVTRTQPGVAAAAPAAPAAPAVAVGQIRAPSTGDAGLVQNRANQSQELVPLFLVTLVILGLAVRLRLAK
jgi:superoxide dismutase, Cu-Zn family